MFMKKINYILSLVFLSCLVVAPAFGQLVWYSDSDKSQAIKLPVEIKIDTLRKITGLPDGVSCLYLSKERGLLRVVLSASGIKYEEHERNKEIPRDAIIPEDEGYRLVQEKANLAVGFYEIGFFVEEANQWHEFIIELIIEPKSVLAKKDNNNNNNNNNDNTNNVKQIVHENKNNKNNDSGISTGLIVGIGAGLVGLTGLGCWAASKNKVDSLI